MNTTGSLHNKLPGGGFQCGRVADAEAGWSAVLCCAAESVRLQG